MAASKDYGIAVGWALAPSPGVPLTYVSNNNGYNTLQQIVSTNNDSWMFRIPAVLGGPVSELSLEVLTRYGQSEATVSAAVTFTKFALEYNGITVPVTFSGARSLTYDAASPPLLVSDPIPATAFGVSNIPADAVVYRRFSLANQTVLSSKPCGLSAMADGAQGFTFTGASDQVDNIGALTPPSGATAVNRTPVVNLLGRFYGAAYPVWAGVGDSLTFGQSDSQSEGTGASGNPPISGTGYFRRATLNPSGNTGAIASVDLGMPGETASNFNGAAGAVRRTMLARVSAGGMGRVWEFMGTNDIGAAGSTTLSTVQNRLNALWASLRAAGIGKIYRMELFPRTTSTDSWATVANQTKVPGWTTGGVAEQVNAWSATRVGVTIDGYSLTRDLVADPVDQSAWAVTGAANYSTADGLHPLTVGHVAVAPRVRTAMLGAY